MKKKGFTLIELLVVVAIIFMLLSLLAVPFIIPWILEKNNVGSGAGDDSFVFTTVTDGGVIFSKGKRSRLEVESPFISSEKISVAVSTPLSSTTFSGAHLSGMQEGNKVYFSWTPKETGFFDVEFEFSDGERKETNKVIIEVVDIR